MPKRPARRTDCLDRPGDVGQAPLARAGAAGGRGEPGPQRVLRRRGQAAQLRRDLPDPDRDRGVAVPAVQDRAAVDRDQVAVVQHLRGAGDGVHDLAVHRGADRRRIALVARGTTGSRRPTGSPRRRWRRASRWTRPAPPPRAWRPGPARPPARRRASSRSAPASCTGCPAAGETSASMPFARNCGARKLAPRARTHPPYDRSASIARTVTSSTGPVASMPTSLPCAP